MGVHVLSKPAAIMIVLSSRKTLRHIHVAWCIVQAFVSGTAAQPFALVTRGGVSRAHTTFAIVARGRWTPL